VGPPFFPLGTQQQFYIAIAVLIACYSLASRSVAYLGSPLLRTYSHCGSTVTSENSFHPKDCFSFLGPHCQGTSAKIYLTDINIKSLLNVLSCNLQRHYHFKCTKHLETWFLVGVCLVLDNARDYRLAGRLAMKDPFIVAALKLLTDC
jgi:hypothetical protein